jgi:ubiquitin C-terminal hydrolase
VSRTLEEFYTVRCQVADMRNLYESLDEVTVKDTLEGDNMYTCSQCGKKVRAEKRLVILQELYIPPWLYVVSVPLFSSVIFSKPPEL